MTGQERISVYMETNANKNVTHAARLLLRLWNWGLFVAVWIMFYNKITFGVHAVEGCIGVLIIHLFVYSWMCNIYKAFRLATTMVSEAVFSQFLSFGMADLAAYLISCIAKHNFADIRPGAVVVCLQLIGTLILCIVFKRKLRKTMRATKTLIVVGTETKPEEAEDFKYRLQAKYSNIYDIAYVMNENEDEARIKARIAECPNTILYGLSDEPRRKYVHFCVENNHNFFFTPRVEDIIFQGCSPRYLLDTPLMKYDETSNDFSKRAAKRALDLALAIIMLVIASPIMLVTALAIKLEDGGPVFFKQKRCTKDAKVFDILKFRSMIVNAEAAGVTPSTKGDPRITRVGNIIRKLRIDELPQLINILIGQMSFVGPRPERVEHVEMYSKDVPEFKYRMKVKGGLTGYAQVYGKYNTTPYDKLRLDLLYIENQSLVLDIKLILLTIRTVFQPESTEGFEQTISDAMNERASDKHVA